MMQKGSAKKNKDISIPSGHDDRVFFENEFFSIRNQFQNSKGIVKEFSTNIIAVPKVEIQYPNVQIIVDGNPVNIPGQLITVPAKKASDLFAPFLISNTNMRLIAAGVSSNNDNPFGFPMELELRVHRGGDDVWPVNNAPGGELMASVFIGAGLQNASFDMNIVDPILRAPIDPNNLALGYQRCAVEKSDRVGIYPTDSFIDIDGVFEFNSITVTLTFVTQ